MAKKTDDADLVHCCLAGSSRLKQYAAQWRGVAMMEKPQFSSVKKKRRLQGEVVSDPSIRCESTSVLGYVAVQ